MLIEVIAVPLAAPPIRLGARFTVREGVPLIIGPSPQARIRLTSAPSDKDLVVEQRATHCVLKTEGVPVASSLNGEPIERDAELTVRDNDHLFIAGLVIRFGERELDPRDAGIERAVGEAPDTEATWSVYADFLLERGAPPLATSRTRRDLGPLADAHRTGALVVEWSSRGFLKRAQLLRSAVVGSPGLFWHLEQLAHLKAARFLTALDVDYFVGTAPAHVDRAFASVDETFAAALKVVANSDFAPSLRTLSFGHVAVTPRLDNTSALFEHVRQRWPHLAGDFRSLLPDGIRARLEVVTVPDEVAVVGLSAGESWPLPPHTTLGSSNECRLRLLGPNIPPQLAVIHRTREGAWTIGAEGVDDMSSRVSSPLKLNGNTVTRATLHADDVIEPIPGLTFRFRPE